MGRFFKKLRDIWSHEELRKRLGITLGFILIYRIGSFIVIPGVDSDTLQEQMSALGGGGLGDILSLFTGGAFTRASIFALGIMPYISASIIMQLMGLRFRASRRCNQESGRKKINQWTRFRPSPSRLVRAIRSSVVSVPVPWQPDRLLVVQRRPHPDELHPAHHVPRRADHERVGNGISLLIMIGITPRSRRPSSRSSTTRTPTCTSSSWRLPPFW